MSRLAKWFPSFLVAWLFVYVAARPPHLTAWFIFGSFALAVIEYVLILWLLPDDPKSKP
jgi:hypothetical protein